MKKVKQVNPTLIRGQVAAAVFLIPIFFFTLNQLLLQILKPADQALSVKLSFAVNPTIYLLFITADIFLILFIFRSINPLFRYLKRGEGEEKARRASLAVPWMLILTNSGLWLATVTLFYALQDFTTEGGVPYFWSLTSNSLSGFVSAISVALIINRVLIPAKMRLGMTDIRQGERDIFVRIKIPLLVFSSFLYTVIVLTYMARYFLIAAASSYAGRMPSAVPVFWAVSALALFPLILNLFLALGEDRIQRRFLAARLRDLTGSGSRGNLSGKVNLINFDEIGSLAASINRFITSIKELVLHVEETGARVVEVSREIDSHTEKLAESTAVMLDLVEKTDSEMETQQKEFETTRDSLLAYFQAMANMLNHIETQSASVEQTSGAVEELAASIRSVTATARDVEGLNRALAEKTAEGSSYMAELVAVIRKIEETSRQVGEILEHMSGLSSQIDMLAMNAAIEAAHAGEAGKGFGVVSDQVRQLAESSAEESREMADRMNAMLDVVNDGNGKTGETEQVFESIREQAEKSSSYFLEIFSALEEESSGTNELVEAVETMLSVTVELRSIAEEQKNSNRRMEERTNGVFDRFGRMRRELENQRTLRSHIDTALAGMKGAARKNLQTVEKLEQQLNRFTVQDEKNG